MSKPNSLCFGKISKFPVFSLIGIFFGHFPCFPCAVGTLSQLRQEHMKPGAVLTGVVLTSVVGPRLSLRPLLYGRFLQNIGRIILYRLFETVDIISILIFFPCKKRFQNMLLLNLSYRTVVVELSLELNLKDIEQKP